MKSPRGPKGPQPANSNQPFDVKHQLGLVRTAGVVPQPTQPHIPIPPMPERMSNIAALKGTKLEKG
jgi:hypothetical protein